MLSWALRFSVHFFWFSLHGYMPLLSFLQSLLISPHCYQTQCQVLSLTFEALAALCIHSHVLSLSPFLFPSHFSSFLSSSFSLFLSFLFSLSLSPGYFFAFCLPLEEIFCFFISTVYSGPSILTPYWSSLPADLPPASPLTSRV